MQTVVNKTFDEIAPGDAASVERTLQAGDMRAWGAAFGEGDMLAGPSEGIVRLNSILPAGAPGRGGAPLFLLMNRQRTCRDSTPKMTYTGLP